MGIREHFRKKTTDEIKLSDIGLEDKDFRPAIEWDRLIMPGDFEALKDRLGIFRFGRHPQADLAEMAMQLKVVFPDRFDEVGLDREVFDGLKKELESYRGQDWYHFIRMAYSMKTLFPKWFEEVNLNFEEIFDGMSSSLNQDHRFNSFLRSPLYYSKLAVLFPERLDDLGLSKDVLKGVLETEPWTPDTNIVMYLGRSASMRLFCADELDLASIRKNKRLWKMVKQKLDQERDAEAFTTSLNVLFGSKILLADEVRLSDKGIELIMARSDYKVEKASRPERRQF